MCLGLIISLSSLFSIVIVFAVDLFFSRLAKNLVFFSLPSMYSALALTIYPLTFFRLFLPICFSCLLVNCYFLVYFFHLRCFVVCYLCL